MPVVGGTGNEVLLKLLVVSQPWKRFRAGADKIATGALLLTLQGHELATAVVNHGDGWVCKPSSAARRATTTASSGVWIDAPITELMLTLNSAYLGQPLQLLVEHLQALPDFLRQDIEQQTDRSPA